GMRGEGRETGTIWEFYIGHQRQIVINHVKHLEKFNKATPKFFERVENPSLEELGATKGLLFNSDYTLWHRNRKFVVPIFTSPKFLRGFVISVQKLFKESEHRWNSIIKDGLVLDFSLWIKCFTTDMMIHQITKQHSHSLASFDTNKEIVDVKCMTDTAINIIEKRKKELDNGVEIESDLLDHLLTSHTPRDPGYKKDDKTAPLNTHEVKAILWDILLAGIDTVNFQQSSFYIFGSDPNIEFTLEKLEECRYIDALIKESLRHVTPIPYSLKVLNGEENVAGYNWPSKTIFWIDQQTILNNPDYWSDPDSFNPDRFL
ncbi:18392_t:CDS:2, partial [Racocetra fulgida]